MDGGQDDGGNSQDAGDAGAGNPYCNESELTTRAFDEAAAGDDFGEKAGDFTVETTDGSWNLIKQWTGCESYMFVSYRRDIDYLEGLLDSPLEDMLAASPRNVHWFFLSRESDDDERAEDVTYLSNRIEDGVAELEEDDSELAAYWPSHLHVVTTAARHVEGFVGDILGGSSTYSFAVDRFQTIRETGIYAEPQTNWAIGVMALAALEPTYFNHEAERQDRLDSDGAIVLRAFDRELASDSGWAGESIEVDVEFPDAATMAQFDTLEIDLTLECQGHPEVASCPAWDYIVNAYLCDEAAPTVCDTEIGRWITTYVRPGRWVHDISPFLAMLGDGGTRRVRFYTQQPYLVTLDFRLRDTATNDVPFEYDFLWTGGAFNETYDALHAPFAFTPPEDSTRVQLVVVLSGHGWGAEVENCAEFCNHEHEFTVNGGATYVKDHPEAGTAYGCAEQVSDGVVPNQYGTWIYGRGGWCPGLEVAQWVVDITDDVTLGAENTIEYRGLFEGEAYVPQSSGSGDGFNANINLVSYLVYSH